MKEHVPTPEEADIVGRMSDISRNSKHPFRGALYASRIPFGTAAAAYLSSRLPTESLDTLSEWATNLGIGIGVGELLMGSAAAMLAHAKHNVQHATLVEDLRYLKEQSQEMPLEELARRATILPPGGAKVIPPASLKEYHALLYPTLLQETITKQVVCVSQSMADKAPEDQITIQFTTAGRHKDPFKRAAMNMILAHPYSESWGTPFFKAEWGELAPLIHDGGAENVIVNRNWQHANGRTDILFRLPPEVFKGENQATLEAYIASRARFYQRASFAAHCHNEITEGAEHQTVFLVPREVKEAGATAWEDYSKLSDRVLFGEYNLIQMLGSEDGDRWFLPTDTGTRLSRYGPRYEADGNDSFFHLMAIEEAKCTHGRVLLQRAAACMDYLSDSVDDMLGLPISSRDSRFSAPE